MNPFETLPYFCYMLSQRTAKRLARLSPNYTSGNPVHNNMANPVEALQAQCHVQLTCGTGITGWYRVHCSDDTNRMETSKERNFVVALAISIVLTSLVVAPKFTSNVEHKETIVSILSEQGIS